MKIDKYSISIFSDPAQTMGHHSDLVAELVPCAHAIVARGFGGDMQTRTLAKIQDRLLGAETLAILDDGDSVVGFATSTNYVDDETVYLDGIVILPELKQRNMGSQLIHAITDGSALPWIACTTQNPIMFCLLRRACARVFPSPDAPETPAYLRRIASRLTGDRGVLDPATFVIRDLYETCRYDAIPASRDEEVNRWFAVALDVRSGVTCDGFFFVGEAFKKRDTR